MKVEIELKDLEDLIFWARRYCDGRRTGVADQFNKIYERMSIEYHALNQGAIDNVLTENGRWWPYAQDGSYDPNTGNYDATEGLKLSFNLYCMRKYKKNDKSFEASTSGCEME